MGKRLALFDVDGTLTPSRKPASSEMKKFIQMLRKHIPVAIVGGSDFQKIAEQLGDSLLDDYDYVFSENGLLGYKNGTKIHEASLKTYLGEEKISEFVNFCLKYISDLDIPIKRGTFVEFRTGMLNVSPIGRNCSQEERDEFERFDAIAGIRKKFVNTLKERFGQSFNLQFSIGGQISFDVFPQGWDKTYCLQFLEEFDEIHFFGDKTYMGGNDYEIFVSDKTIGHTVKSPAETIELCSELFL